MKKDRKKDTKKDDAKGFTKHRLFFKEGFPDELILRVTKLSEKTLKIIKESIQYG
jgi:hypothetical protein